MIDFLNEIPLLIDRITAKTAGFKTIAPLDDYPNGGNFEADTLPACFIGDSGDNYNFSSKKSLYGLKNGFFFASIIVERKAGSYQQSKNLLDAVTNAILYEQDNVERWQPSGHDYPFALGEQRGAAIYAPTFVIRNIIFTSQQYIS